MSKRLINPIELCGLFISVKSKSLIAFATAEHFYFDSYDYKYIAKQCGDEVEIEQVYIDLKQIGETMVFRINIEEFYKYHEKIGDIRSEDQKRFRHANPNLPISRQDPGNEQTQI